MSATVIPTTRLRLVLETTEGILAQIEAMDPDDRAQVSPDWLEQMRNAPPSPWTHSFSMVERTSDEAVGSCGYKGAPDADGVVEIAYAVNTDCRGRGFAKEAASALVDYARTAGARIVRAHTLPARGASTSVLAACRFEFVGEVIDPEDGLVWRWEHNT
jgi:[ribosomal protein S5]-alanine N-acetyltransferase